MTDGMFQNPIGEPIVVQGITPTRAAADSSNQSSLAEKAIVASQSDASILIAELNKVSNSSDSLETMIRGCKDVVCQFGDATGLWMSQKGERGEFEDAFSLLGHSESASIPVDSRQSKKLMKLALQHRQIQSLNIASDELIVAAPVVDGAQISAILIGHFTLAGRSVSDIELLLGTTCQTIATWLAKQRCIQTEVRMRSLNDVVVMSRELNRCTNINSAAIVLVNQLKKLTGAQQIVFAIESTNSLPQVLAISDLDEIVQDFDGLKAMRLACAQALESGEMSIYPDRRNQSDWDQALQQYCRKLGHEACIALPLKKGATGDMLGCLLIATTAVQLAKPTFTSYLNEIGQMLSGHLAVILKANRGLVDHALSSLNRNLTAGRSKIAAAISLSALALMLVPWPYKIHCDCELQPVSRRFVAAPHDGILQKNLVESGDVISAGQAIAMLDDRQLRMEMAGLQAELQGANKQRSSATARGSIAESQIAASQARKLNAEIELVNSKLKNLEITSPIAGIVVAGDLEKVEGAPVEMGQTLFEIGPLNKMLIEIAVPEEEITYVETGMSIAIKLNAYPFETWHGNVSRVHPKSEIRDSKSVFIAEVEIDNAGRKLKPGMQGSAKIKSGAYPIGWNLFHRPMEQLRYWTIW